jgi:branched-chain amino acid aminotransferase
MSVTWCNGAFVDQLTLDPAERGVMLGDGIFETIAVRSGKPIWLDEHLARMTNAAKELQIAFDTASITKSVGLILKHSEAAAEVLRITLTRGPTARGLAAEGLTPSLLLSLNSFDHSKLPATLRLATSSIRRNASAPSSRLKTLSYIDAIAAAREVAARADDAVMLNTQGHVASNTVANIFLLKGQALITPAADQGILNGIARQKLLEAATHLSLRPEERAVKPQELHEADAVFLTNSLRLAIAVTSIDGRASGTRDISFIKVYYEKIIGGESS